MLNMRQFKKAVGTFMQKMNDLDEIPLVEYTRDFEDITYTENEKTMLVNYLSAGYQSLLWMLMEISFRIALLNPEMSDYSQAEGIVLIDEIDMHLHRDGNGRFWTHCTALSRKFSLSQQRIRQSLFRPLEMQSYCP